MNAVILAEASGGMTFLVIVLLGSLTLGWVVGIAEIAGKSEEDFASGTRTTWLLLVILTGVIGLVGYVMVGKKRTNAQFPQAAGFDDGPPAAQDEAAATARREMSDDFGFGLGATSAPVHYSFGRPVSEPGPSASTRSDPGDQPRGDDESPEQTLKTCPDCAEEVRAAARKCRFCGYVFADIQAPV